MEDNREFNMLLTKIEYHIEEEISFINEVCSENFEYYDNETISFYLLLRQLFKNYKKDLRQIIKDIEKRKDNL